MSTFAATLKSLFMPNKKKIRFIVNPISGTSNKNGIIKQIGKNLDVDLYDYEIVVTEQAGHATVLAREAVEKKYFAVIAIGGDGTVNEIGKSLIHTDTALGIIPSGSGDGLARTLHIPHNTQEAIKIINSSLIHRIDYGSMCDNSFFCTCGMGFDAFISMKFQEADTRGLRTYVEKTLYEYLRYKPETYTLVTDSGEKKYKAFLIACANASQYGNNAYIAPQASLHDGLMDVSILEPFTMVDIPKLALQLFTRTIDWNGRIKTFKCRKMTIHRAAEGVVHADGDPMMMGKDIDVEIIHGGLKVIVPRRIHSELPFVKKTNDFINPLLNEITIRNKKFIKKNLEYLEKLKNTFGL